MEETLSDPRDLARLALDPAFSLPAALERAEPSSVVQAIANYEAGLLSLKQEPDFATAAGPLRTALKAIGAKVSPQMSGNQVSAWLDAVSLSLSIFPAKVAASAARAAIHEPFKFLGDVDAKLHELAQIELERHKLALWRLNLMRKEIQRAANPLNQLEHMDELWTQEKIDEANATFVKVGAKTRYRLSDGGTCEAYEALIDGGDIAPDSVSGTEDGPTR
jgi:hypothetical protein